MSTLYIRLPSKAAAETAQHWVALPCPFALVSTSGAIEGEGREPLSQLSELVARARQVVLLLAASDVSLMRMQVPPLPPGKLKAALPNLVEDQLITDPAECVIVAGPASEGRRTIAVVQRAWLEILVRTFTTWGAHHLSALPAQLSLPWQAQAVTAAVSAHETDIDVALRLSEHDGIGLPILPEQAESAPRDVINALSAVVPQGAIILQVPPAMRAAYEQAVDEMGEPAQRISVQADHWESWIGAARGQQLNLMEGLAMSGSSRRNWQRWRWPLALLGALLLVHIVGLNIEWSRMKSEAAALRSTMTQTYRSVYPNDPVILDPVAQMRQKIAAAKHASGQPAPDDFIVLAAAFGDAWSSVGGRGGNNSAIAGIEYRDRNLFVRLKPGTAVSVEQMQAALARHNLTLQPVPSANEATVWQIRRNR